MPMLRSVADVLQAIAEPSHALPSSQQARNGDDNLTRDDRDLRTHFDGGRKGSHGILIGLPIKKLCEIGSTAGSLSADRQSAQHFEVLPRGVESLHCTAIRDQTRFCMRPLLTSVF